MKTSPSRIVAWIHSQGHIKWNSNHRRDKITESTSKCVPALSFCIRQLEKTDVSDEGSLSCPPLSETYFLFPMCLLSLSFWLSRFCLCLWPSTRESDGDLVGGKAGEKGKKHPYVCVIHPFSTEHALNAVHVGDMKSFSPPLWSSVSLQ